MQDDKFKLFDIIKEFLNETNMQWNHGQWLSLLSRVERAGFVVNPEQLGIMLENERKQLRIKKVKEHYKRYKKNKG